MDGSHAERACVPVCVCGYLSALAHLKIQRGAEMSRREEGDEGKQVKRAVTEFKAGVSKDGHHWDIRTKFYA